MLRNSAVRTDGRPAAADDTAVRDQPESLVSLLGDARAALVTYLQRAGEAGVGDLADHLGISEVATRRHLGVLAEQDLVTSRDVVDGPGRPARRYRLTERATRLFPQRTAAVADELLTFLEDTQGREGLRAYLRWRLARQTAQLEEQVTADDLPERLDQLAAALSEAGFDATVDVAGDRFVLRQDHCAIYDVAKEHPEICAYEAATFSQVLGRDVRLSRQQTRPDGGNACVCCVTPRSADGPPPERCLPVLTEPATTPQ